MVYLLRKTKYNERTAEDHVSWALLVSIIYTSYKEHFVVNVVVCMQVAVGIVSEL